MDNAIQRDPSLVAFQQCVCWTTPCPKRRYKIYTKTGDSGTSSLYNGARHPKDAQHFVALGDVDELNCAVGVARQFVADHPQLDALGEQVRMFRIENFLCV